MAKRAATLIIGICFMQLTWAQDSGFSSCIAELQDRARGEGHPQWVVDQVLASLQQQDRVLELDRAQPEFIQTFAEYFYRRVTPTRVTQGRELRKEYRAFLEQLTSRYGIPGHYLLAFWGLETNFGGYLGKMPVLDSLATLACDERRSRFFADELMAALKLLQRESLIPADMQGSWAGAMGHTQFMPTAYTRYAVDGDGDGQANLWRSERDALASGANFLARLGWRRGERWGREVLLPDDFPYAESGLKNRQPLAYWAGLGVRMANGGRLPAVDIPAAILVPAGHTGPAFIVYPNFEVIMRWNRSVSYALSVGVLADRIAGAGDLLRPPSRDETALSRSTVQHLQGRLNHLGFAAGDADGFIGPTTRSALREFQSANGMVADGYPDADTLQALQIDKDPSG